MTITNFKTSNLDELNILYEKKSPEAILEHALGEGFMSLPCLVSSFGAESVALLNMVATLDPTITVVLIDTGKLFNETLRYRDRLQEELGLERVMIARPNAAELKNEDPNGTLHAQSTDACCEIRKVKVMSRALSGFESWISGRKRFQSSERNEMKILELDDSDRIKLNPLANSTTYSIRHYINKNCLIDHPLLSQGYPSIGCLPCTSKVTPGADVRSGRWNGQNKTECGIHNRII